MRRSENDVPGAGKGAGRGFALRFLMGILSLAFGLLLIAALFFSPDGNERGDWIQFIGRFHPLIVHFPIALIFLAPLMELLGRFQRWHAIRDAVPLVLALAALSVIPAVVCGWLLAYGSGYQGDLVERHMWGGIALAAACLLCLALRPRSSGSRAGRAQHGYVAALIITLGLMGWTSHQGGSLTRGEDYLVERMPAPVRDWLGIETRALALAHEPADAFYATHIQPIFEDHCVLCHGSNKVKGKLRLDSFAALMQGGESGRVVAAGHPEGSELYRRITLPGDHEEFMPAENKKPPTGREIALIEQWILAGSSPVKTLADLRAGGADIPAEETAESPPPPRAPDHRRKAEEIAALETKLGVSLVPVSRVPTDGLIVRTFGNSKAIDDETLAGLAPIAELIVEAELMRTRVTDAGMEAVAGFANLCRLDLSETAVTSAGVARLASLPHLQWISLVRTEVDDAGAAHLRTFPALRKAYLFDAKLSDQSITQLSFENEPETSARR